MVAIRRVHTLAILAIEGGDAEEALRHLAWVEAELVVLTEASTDHVDDLRSIAAQQRQALIALREGRLDDSLGLVRTVLSELTLADENVSRGRNPHDAAAIVPN